MMPSSIQNTDPPQFNWRPEYDDLLNSIASTDLVDTDWLTLREIIKYKIDKNVNMFLAETRPPPPPPPTFGAISFPSGGLRLPPFPPRKPNQMHASEIPVSYMTPEQAHEMKESVFAQLHDFDDNPPFTIQRVCELCLQPRRHYSSVGKYLRALEKSLLVTSSWNSFPPLSDAERDSTGLSNLSFGPSNQSAPSTPLFSPIPFLHDDARRSKSRSPPPSPLALPTTTQPGTGPSRAIGLVDELDDPSPGHMSEHPTPLTSVTGGSRPLFGGSLEQRFVREEQEHGAEGDNMMNVDDDKENNKA